LPRASVARQRWCPRLRTLPEVPAPATAVAGQLLPCAVLSTGRERRPSTLARQPRRRRALGGCFRPASLGIVAHRRGRDGGQSDRIGTLEEGERRDMAIRDVGGQAEPVRHARSDPPHDRERGGA
jgi:hypothetical protein